VPTAVPAAAKPRRPATRLRPGPARFPRERPPPVLPALAAASPALPDPGNRRAPGLL